MINVGEIVIGWMVVVVVGLVSSELVVVVVVVSVVGEVVYLVTVVSVSVVLVVVRLMLLRLDVESVLEVSRSSSDFVVVEVVSAGSVST
jgi:hypothetical protein